MAKCGNTAYSMGPHLDIKVHKSEADVLRKDTGLNPFCYFNGDFINILNLNGETSCKRPAFNPYGGCTTS